MKPALPRLALTFLFSILGCHATPVPAAAPSASSPAGGGADGRAGKKATLDYPKGAPAAYFASPTGSATGEGSMGDPWDLQTAMDGGHPPSTVRAGDTVWLRGGTYIGSFTCALHGTLANGITFRGYPGERATIDQARAPNVLVLPVINLSKSSHIILRDLEVMNSNTDRWTNSAMKLNRGEAIRLASPHSKIINCVLHDAGQGIGAWGTAPGAEIYGNLIYHNGFKQKIGEYDSGAAIDLIPPSGSSVALTGSYSNGYSRTSPATIPHNNTGNYTVVVASVAVDTAYNNLSATYDGAAMTLLNGKTSPGHYPIAVFGIAGHPGMHDVLVSCTNTNSRIWAVAQSFSSVESATAEGTWTANQWMAPPFASAASSDTNHMVVDGVTLFSSYGTGYGVDPATDNTLIRLYNPIGSNNPGIGMSYAPGAANVRMGWTWDPNTAGHGHGIYLQEYRSRDNVVTVKGDNTITSASNPWLKENAGDTIVIEGAGPDGAILNTTISDFHSAGSVKVAAAPSTSIPGGTTAIWAPGKLVKDNIIYDQLGAATIQAYGSSKAACLATTISGNLHAGPSNSFYLGGLSGYYLTDTVVNGDFTWKSRVNIGYHMSHYTNFRFTNNYATQGCGLGGTSERWEELTLAGNTIVGPLVNFTQSDFPDNAYYAAPPIPTSNLVVIRPNVYEANRANIFIYNWEDFDNVDVDLSAAVAPGTAIDIFNAQDFYADAVWSGTYTGGSVSLPMDGLTAAAGIGYTASGPTGRGFNAFIVRAQDEGTWRRISDRPSPVPPKKPIRPPSGAEGKAPRALPRGGN